MRKNKQELRKIRQELMEAYEKAFDHIYYEDADDFDLDSKHPKWIYQLAFETGVVFAFKYLRDKIK